MNIGIDGNMWYCSNGLGLPEPHAEFVFERTLKEAVTQFHKQFKCVDEVPKDLHKYMDMTPEQYRAAIGLTR